MKPNNPKTSTMEESMSQTIDRVLDQHKNWGDARVALKRAVKKKVNKLLLANDKQVEKKLFDIREKVMGSFYGHRKDREEVVEKLDSLLERKKI